MYAKNLGKIKHLQLYCINRMRENFQLCVLTLIGGFILIALIPFATYRLINGYVLIFAIEMTIILVSILLISYAWIKNDVVIPSYIMASSSSLSNIFMAELIGPMIYFWFFCSITIYYALLKPKQALIFVSVNLVIMVTVNDLFSSLPEKMTFIASAGATILFGYIIARTREYQRNLLIRIARTDPLTGAANRRASTEELNIAISDFKRTQKPYMLISFDVDHFKDINDVYGHEVGDRTLIKLVKLIYKNTRSKDRLFRIGGEEFMLLVDKICDEDVLILAEKLRQVVEDAPIINERPVTISCGIARLTNSDDAKSWEKRADDALYKAKHAGRNCCRFADHAIFE